MQKRLLSAIEALSNTVIGFAINYAMTLAVLPLFGFEPSYSDAAGITGLFLVASLARSYILRRAFNSFSKSG